MRAIHPLLVLSVLLPILVLVATASGQDPKTAQAMCDLQALANLNPAGRVKFPPASGPFDLRPVGAGRYVLSSYMDTQTKGRIRYGCEMSFRQGAWKVDRVMVCSDC